MLTVRRRPQGHAEGRNLEIGEGKRPFIQWVGARRYFVFVREPVVVVIEVTRIGDAVAVRIRSRISRSRRQGLTNLLTVFPAFCASTTEPRRAAQNRLHAADIGVRGNIFPGNANGEVGKTIVVKVPGGQALAESIVGFVHTADARCILVEPLPARCAQSVEAGVEHNQTTRIDHRTQVFTVNPNGQIGAAVVVEIARGQAAAEKIARFDPAGNA